MPTKLSRAKAAIEALRYNGANLELALYWLSLWRGDEPPKLAAFDGGPVWQHDPAIMICRVEKGKSLTCVQSGAFIRTALGFDVRDHDLLSLTPVGHRDERLAWAWAIVEGAATVLYREFKSPDGPGGFAQGIALPLSDRPADGSRLYLMHTNWRPVGNEWMEGHVSVDLHNPVQREMIRFDMIAGLARTAWLAPG